MQSETTLQRHLSARLAYEAGDLQSAMAIVQECFADDRNDGRAWELCGLIHFSSGNFQRSVSALECAQCLVPLLPAARVCLGHAYGKIGKTVLSRDVLHDLIDDDSVSIPLLLQVAIGLDAVGAPEYAIQACEMVIERDDRVAQAHYDYGYYAGRCGYHDSYVENSARTAIELDPKNVQYRVGLAGLLWRQDRLDEAYEVVHELPGDLLLEIECTCCLRRMSDLYKRAGDYRRLVLCQERLLRLDMIGNQTTCE